MRYFFDRDNSFHWYIVQADKRAEWQVWRNMPDDDPRGWETPAYANRITSPIFYTFESPLES